MSSRTWAGIAAVAIVFGGCASVLGLPDEYHGGSEDTGHDAGMDLGTDVVSGEDAFQQDGASQESDALQQSDAPQDSDALPEDASSEPFDPEAGHEDAPPDAPPDSNPETGIVALTTSQVHACALVQLGAADRQVHCWGTCNSLFLGADCVEAGIATGPVLDESYLAITDAIDIAAGADYTCILRPAGKVQCWGINGYGQIGNGSPENAVARPSNVIDAATGLALEGIVLIAAHGLTSCGANAAGEIYCWGVSPLTEESLGRATKLATLSPNLKKLAVGTSGHVCAIDSQNKLLCWGRNGAGEASAGKVDAGAFVTTPIEIVTTKTVLDVGLGHQQSCAAEGAVIQCWGAWNDGTPSSGIDSIPLNAVSGNYVQLAGGYFGNCARTDTGKVMCFGQNAWAWVGSPQPVDQKAPYFIKSPDGTTDLQGMKLLASAGDFSCAASSTEAYCWGDFTYEQGVYSCRDLLPDGGLDARCSENAVRVEGLPTF